MGPILIRRSRPSIATMPPRAASSAAPAPTSRKTFAPRPARPLEERLKKLHGALLDQIHDGFLDNAVRTCKKSVSHVVLNARTPSAETLMDTLSPRSPRPEPRRQARKRGPPLPPPPAGPVRRGARDRLDFGPLDGRRLHTCRRRLGAAPL